MFGSLFFLSKLSTYFVVLFTLLFTYFFLLTFSKPWLQVFVGLKIS